MIHIENCTLRKRYLVIQTITPGEQSPRVDYSALAQIHALLSRIQKNFRSPKHLDIVTYTQIKKYLITNNFNE